MICVREEVGGGGGGRRARRGGDVRLVRQTRGGEGRTGWRGGPVPCEGGALWHASRRPTDQSGGATWPASPPRPGGGARGRPPRWRLAPCQAIAAGGTPRRQAGGRRKRLGQGRQGQGRRDIVAEMRWRACAWPPSPVALLSPRGPAQPALPPAAAAPTACAPVPQLPLFIPHPAIGGIACPRRGVPLPQPTPRPPHPPHTPHPTRPGPTRTSLSPPSQPHSRPPSPSSPVPCSTCEC